MRISFQIIVILIAVGMVVGCSSDNPVLAPDYHPDTIAPAAIAQGNHTDNRVVWGFWNIRIENETVEIIPDRTTALHFNTVRLLEVDPCTNCLTIENIQFPTQNEITANFRILHPFPGLLRFTGFDVRGILITGSDYTFPVSGRSVNLGDGFPRLINADGFTQLFNPTEYPEGVTEFPALGYITGKYSMGENFTATLNPYIAYKQDAPRRHFEAGSAETRSVHLWRPDGPLEFGYSVDASWVPVEEVSDPLIDFPPEANAFEAYDIEIMGGNSFQLTTGIPEEIFVEVWDHQGLTTISNVTVEAPDLFSGEILLEFSSETGEDSWLFSGLISNELNAEVGEYPLLCRVQDTWVDGNLGVVDGWQTGEVTVNEGPETGWARTWGADGDDQSYRVAVDQENNVFVIGHFKNTVDFDSGPGDEQHSSKGGFDVFLSKFDTDGTLQWTRTWGGIDIDHGYKPAVYGLDSVYVTGRFMETVDFDPGPVIDQHVSQGDYDIYLTKFDPVGTFQWVRTWGNTGSDQGLRLAIDIGGNVYVTGEFMENVDFDPGPGTDEHSSEGYNDIFLSKLPSNGTFQWVKTWGGISNDRGCGIDIDTSGIITICGNFGASVDFDPGAGMDLHISNGGIDLFLSKFDMSGSYLWTRTWGGVGYDQGFGTDVDLIGNTYIIGWFSNTFDFDPGSGLDEHISNGSSDAFLIKLLPDGYW